MVNTDVAIVGAGIGGLTLAYRLNNAGIDTLLLEADSRAGGWIHSIEKEGFLLEAGPNSTFRSEHLKELAQDLGLSEELITPNVVADRKFLVKDFKNKPSRLTPVPRSLLESATTNILSPLGKLRVFAEAFFPRTAGSDVSVKEFVSRRLGKEVAENIVAPALSGIWAADISKLSARSALPMLWEAEQTYGSLLLGGPRVKKKKGRREMVTFRKGLSQLSDALGAALGESCLKLGHAVQSIEANQSGAQIVAANTTYLAKHVVLTTPADVTASLLTEEFPEITENASSLPYAPVGVMHVVAQEQDVERTLSGFGFLAPPKAGRALLGTVYTSTLFPERAPAGQCLLTCFVGGASNPQLADVTSTANQENVLGDLKNLLGIGDSIRVLDTHYHRRAIPNFPLKHFQTQAAIDVFHEEQDRISVLANWDRGISVVDRIEQAELRASKLIKRFS